MEKTPHVHYVEFPPTTSDLIKKYSATDEYSTGRIRRMVNYSHDSGALTPGLCDYVRAKIKHEADFHDEEWMQNVLKDLEKIIIEVPTKRLRYEKFMEARWKSELYPLEKVVTKIEAAVKKAKQSSDGLWYQTGVTFTQKDNITMEFKEKGHIGLLRKAIVNVHSPHVLILTLDEYIDGFPTGNEIRVFYDALMRFRYLCTDKE